ncbi:MAG: hypothetical protein AAFX87_04525 [Bacteroidota bacterium]
MGYMGFGMRKEVYQRKPKAAFENVKSAVGNSSSKSKETYRYKQYESDTQYRIKTKLKRQKRKSTIYLSLIGLGSIVLLSSIFYVSAESSFYSTTERNKKDPNRFFTSHTYSIGKGIELIVIYYKGGTKAAETKYKDGLKHQNAESWYESGEQFMSAVYWYDTLVNVVYFYPNGDTITSFPHYEDSVVRHITLTYPDSSQRIEFDLYRGLHVPWTYKQIKLIEE